MEVSGQMGSYKYSRCRDIRTTHKSREKYRSVYNSENDLDNTIYVYTSIW